MDNPRARGLHELGNTSAVASWEFAETNAELRDRFQRLDKRGVLDAVGFFLR